MSQRGTEVRRATFRHYFNGRNVRWMNDPVVVQHLRFRPRVTLWSAGKYFLKNRRENMLLAIHHNGEHVGNCGFFTIEGGTAELRICIGETSVWGKGVGAEAVRQMIEVARERRFKTVWLQVGQSNQRARRLYEKLGFKKTGVEMAGDALQDRMELKLD
jgi:RimJ/RimL family protein N-acetyltransferase